MSLSEEEHAELETRSANYIAQLPLPGPLTNAQVEWRVRKAYFDGMLSEIEHRSLLREQRNQFRRGRDDCMAMLQKFYLYVKEAFARQSQNRQGTVELTYPSDIMERAERLTRSGYQFPVTPLPPKEHITPSELRSILGYGSLSSDPERERQ